MQSVIISTWNNTGKFEWYPSHFTYSFLLTMLMSGVVKHLVIGAS